MTFDFLTIRRHHVGWSLPGNREKKGTCQISSLKGGRLRVKQCSTAKQNGYLQSGHLREVVTMRELTVVANEISRAGIPLFGLYGDVPLERVWFFGLVVLNREYNI